MADEKSEKWSDFKNKLAELHKKQEAILIEFAQQAEKKKTEQVKKVIKDI